MTVNIKIHRYLIAFLEHEFGPQPIVFPKGQLLNRTLYFLTQIPPPGWKERQFGTENCQVEIPFLFEKNPATYFYLSEDRMRMFAMRVRDLFMTKFHGFILAAHASGITSRSEIVNLFAEENQLFGVPSVIDLLEKDYKRFMDRQRIRSKRKINFVE